MQLKVKCNSGLLLFFGISVCDCFKKLRPLSQPIRFKIETNNDDLVTRVFPRFWQATCFYFEFSLVCDDVNLCSQLKTALFFSGFFFFFLFFSFFFRNKELALFLILKKIKVWYKICWISKSSLTAS